MSEKEKKSLESMVAALNRVPAEKHDQLINYLEGFAAGAEFARQGKEPGDHAETEKV